MIGAAVRRLGSLQLTWWILIAIGAWLGLGLIAAEQPFFAQGLSDLNNLLVRDWLLHKALKEPWVLAWLMMLLLQAAVLALNLVVCLWQRLERQGSAEQALRFWLFLSLHILFGVLMVMHGLEMVLGEKQPWQSVQAGQKLRLDSVWSAKVHKLQFENDLRLLELSRQERRRKMTKDRFALQQNLVRVSLLKDGKLAASRDIRILNPLSHGGIHVVLRRFEYGPQGLSAQMRIARSPLQRIFLAVYSLFIFSLMLWLGWCLSRI